MSRDRKVKFNFGSAEAVAGRAKTMVLEGV